MIKFQTLAGDVACLSGSMVEDQPRLLGSRVRFPAGAFAIFSVSAKASLPISLSLSLRPFICAKKRILCIYPINDYFAVAFSFHAHVERVCQGSSNSRTILSFSQIVLFV